MAYKSYSKQQEERQSRTKEGAEMLAKSKAQVAKVKSMPRRIISSTGSMVRRAVENVLPKREMTFTRTSGKKKGSRGVSVKTRIGY